MSEKTRQLVQDCVASIYRDIGTDREGLVGVAERLIEKDEFERHFGLPKGDRKKAHMAISVAIAFLDRLATSDT